MHPRPPRSIHCVSVADPRNKSRAGVESQRLTEVYGHYESGSRKSRAWRLDNPGTAAIRAALVERVLDSAREEVRSGGDILDIGCGSGWWLEVLRDQGAAPKRLHGIDAIQERVERARETLPGADLRVGDIRALPYDEGSFAFVLFISVLSDLPGEADVQAALREADRVLIPGGLMLCYEPRTPNPFNPEVRRISGKDFDDALGPDWKQASLTAIPQLSRRLGSLTPTLYPILAKVPLLRTHRLVEYRK